MSHYPYTVGALLLALLVYSWAGFRVGKARSQFGVQAPAVHGNEAFERVFRAHQNTVEQLVIFLPLLAVAAWLWGDLYAAIYGLVWSLGRLLLVILLSAIPLGGFFVGRDLKDTPASATT